MVKKKNDFFVSLILFKCCRLRKWGAMDQYILDLVNESDLAFVVDFKSIGMRLALNEQMMLILDKLCEAGESE